MQLVAIQPREHILPIDNWQEYRRDGEQFLATAAAAWAKGKKAFTPEVLYNLTAMAIEKYIMAFLMRRGDLAENHTMADLAEALERHTGPLPDLRRQLLFLDSFQEICDLDNARYLRPDAEQVALIIATGQEVERLLAPLLREEDHSPEADITNRPCEEQS